MAIPICVGWALGDMSAGLMGATGGFTSLYGSGRPYPHRARLLAAVAVAFAAAVGLGKAVAGVPLWVVPTVAVIAMLSTWLGNALRLGPPGAYLFMLACAAGTAMPAPHISAGQAFVYVLGGGLLAWCVHMAGAAVAPRGPERAAVSQAAVAVGQFLDLTDDAARAPARQRAALALHDAWHALNSFQPAWAPHSERLNALRAATAQLHQCFAHANAGAAASEGWRAAAQVRVATLAAGQWPNAVEVEHNAVPLRHPGLAAAARQALAPGTASRQVIVRVGVAAAVAGVLGALTGLERAYWAVAAAVLMLHQGMDWARTVQRSVERTVGTWLGLVLAGAILWWSPHGLWLAVVIGLLQFAVEMLVLRNYALAAIFITAAGMTLASGGQPVASLPHFLWARGVDTLVGCAVALVTLRLMPTRPAPATVASQLQRALRAQAQLLRAMAGHTLGTASGWEARSELSCAGFALSVSEEVALWGCRVAKPGQLVWWPAVAAVQQLSYRLLSAAWVLENDAALDAPATALAGMRDPVAVAHLATELENAAQALQAQRAVHLAYDALPAYVAADVRAVFDGLSGITAAAASTRG